MDTKRQKHSIEHLLSENTVTDNNVIEMLFEHQNIYDSIASASSHF